MKFGIKTIYLLLASWMALTACQAPVSECPTGSLKSGAVLLSRERPYAITELSELGLTETASGYELSLKGRKPLEPGSPDEPAMHFSLRGEWPKAQTEAIPVQIMFYRSAKGSLADPAVQAGTMRIEHLSVSGDSFDIAGSFTTVPANQSPDSPPSAGTLTPVTGSFQADLRPLAKACR